MVWEIYLKAPMDTSAAFDSAKQRELRHMEGMVWEKGIMP